MTLSLYTLIGIVVSVDGEAVRDRQRAVVPARIVGGFLVGLAALPVMKIFFNPGAIVSTLLNGSLVDPWARILWTLDPTVQVPALLLGGILLWRREALGYVVAGGLLLQSTAYVMGRSIIDLRSVITTGLPIGGPERSSSWIALSVISLILFTFLALFVRCLVSSQRTV